MLGRGPGPTFLVRNKILKYGLCTGLSRPNDWNPARVVTLLDFKLISNFDSETSFFVESGQNPKNGDVFLHYSTDEKTKKSQAGAVF